MDLACATGLCDYGTHEGMPAKVEKALHIGLQRHLVAGGYKVVLERPYPGSRKTCDLFVIDSEGHRFWIELKLAWRQWFYEHVKRNKDGLYRPYLFGPLVPGWEKTHSVYQDTEKLGLLGPKDGDTVGVVGVGLDSASGEVAADLAELAVLARLRERGWHVTDVRTWIDRHCAECRLTCWFWWKQTGAIQLPNEMGAVDNFERNTSSVDAEKIARAALEWAEEQPDEVRTRAAVVFRKFMTDEKRRKKVGSAWIDSWTWEQAIAEILQVPPDSDLVLRTGRELRAREHTYQVENFDDDWRFDRLLDNFEKALFG
jgi:hypothetical protein